MGNPYGHVSEKCRYAEEVVLAIFIACEGECGCHTYNNPQC